MGIHWACPRGNVGHVLVAKLNDTSTEVYILVYFLGESYKKLKWKKIGDPVRRGGTNPAATVLRVFSVRVYPVRESTLSNPVKLCMQ